MTSSARHHCKKHGYWIKIQCRFSKCGGQKPQRATSHRVKTTRAIISFRLVMTWTSLCQIAWGWLTVEGPSISPLERVNEELQGYVSSRCPSGRRRRRASCWYRRHRDDNDYSVESKAALPTSVRHIPRLSHELYFIGWLTKDVGPVTFERNGCFAETMASRWKLGARRKNWGYLSCAEADSCRWG